MENSKIRFLTRNIEDKEPHEILCVSKSGSHNYSRMFESLSCYYVYWDCFDVTKLRIHWNIPNFVPYLEVVQVE